MANYDFMYYVNECQFNNKLMFVAITSSAKGMIEHEGFSFGEGKSNLAMGLSEVLHKQKYPDHSQSEINEMVIQNMGYDDLDVVDMVKRGMDERIQCWVSDDMEVSFGKHKSYDNKFRELAYFMQTIRPYCAVFIGTMPDLGQIASAWRDLFMFEIKVPFRGYCEVQRIKKWSDFRDPLNVKERLEYHGEQEFPIANEELQKWYGPWRDKRVKMHHDRIVNTFYKQDEEEEPINRDELSNIGKKLAEARWNKKRTGGKNDAER